MAKRQGMPGVSYDVIKLAGGLDLVTPTLSLPAGAARDAVNFEVSITGGYTRIAGYERYDGRPSPAAAQYSELTINITGAIAVGNTISGATSGASGYVIVVDGQTVAYTKGAGTFQIGEDVKVGGVVQGSVTALQAGVATGLKTAAEWAALAADAYRGDIQAVPGSGPVRGVAYYNSKVYAWRNNTLGTALVMYLASGSGWQQVSLGYELEFSTGAAEILDGDTVVGAVSGATGVVTRVVKQSGAWAAVTAAGRLIFASITGTFQNGEALKVGGSSKAVCVGTQAAITLAPGGRVETVVGNVIGSSVANRMYGADGKNRAFEYDGTVYVPIETGMAVDTPNHVSVHVQHLFLSFSSSLQHSALGDPYAWTVILGAGELMLPESINALLVQPGNQNTAAMVVYTETNTHVLYGTSSADWNLVAYNVGTGGKAYTAQNMAQGYVFDVRGVVNMATTLNYGNFDSATLTLNIRPFIQQRRTLATASTLNREKAQYRVFFSDGYGLYLTIANGQMLGSMPVQFPNPVACACDGPITSGAETSFFGSTNGFVYWLDVGTSFDGADIQASMTLNFNSEGSPRVLKRYRKGSLEVSGSTYAEFAFGYDLAYSSLEIVQDVDTTHTTNLTASKWDAATWDAFVFDGRVLSPSEVEMRGTGENVAVRISSVSNMYAPFTINSAILHYTPRRGLR